MSAVDWWTREKRVIRAEVLPGDLADPQPFTRREWPGALRIAQGCAYDPGSAVYRFHSAVNETTPHASLFVRMGHSNPYTDYRQIDHWDDYDVLRQAIAECDVAHCHIDYCMVDLAHVPMREGAVLIRNYHGSVAPNPLFDAAAHEDARRRLFQIERDRELGAVIVGARLDHLLEGDDIAWLPMTQPVHRYAALRARLRSYTPFGIQRPMRIGHSPTAPKIKGTADLLAAVEALQRRGRKVELCLIEKQSHRRALEIKAGCDVFFDSFFLGIQGSGLEAGAMGIPVVAGDAKLRALHEQHVGHCPYVYANDRPSLERALEQLFDPVFYQAAAETVRSYVWGWHSYEAVAAKYLRILSARSARLATKIAEAQRAEPDPDDEPAATERPPITTPKAEPVRAPVRERATRPARQPARVPRGEPIQACV